MSIFLFIFKSALKILSVLGIAKLLAWVFGISNDNYDEEKQTVGWWREVRARPSLLIRPLFTLILLPALLYVGIDWSMHSSSQFAASIREISALLWPFVKWMFIIVTFAGINWLAGATLVSSKDDKKLPEKWDWICWSYRYRYSAIFFLVNILMLWGIYYQLPPKAQLAVDRFFVEQAQSHSK